MAVNVPTKTLPSGASIPMIGLPIRTWRRNLQCRPVGAKDRLPPHRYCYTLRKRGRRRAIRDSGLPRQEIFVASKIFFPSWSYDEVIAGAKVSNDKLGLGYIDLYLLHGPCEPEGREDAWRALEDLRGQGILKDIGVSNFSEAHLEKLFKTARIKPAVNQVELHPWMMRSSLVKYCQEHDILMEAYSPLARATKMDDPTLVSIAKEVNASPAQVLIAFGLANGFVTLPKSVRAERLTSNLESAKFKLSPEQVAKLASPDSYIRTAGWDPIKDQID